MFCGCSNEHGWANQGCWWFSTHRWYSSFSAKRLEEGKEAEAERCSLLAGWLMCRDWSKCAEMPRVPIRPLTQGPGACYFTSLLSLLLLPQVSLQCLWVDDYRDSLTIWHCCSSCWLMVAHTSYCLAEVSHTALFPSSIHIPIWSHWVLCCVLILFDLKFSSFNYPLWYFTVSTI